MSPLLFLGIFFIAIGIVKLIIGLWHKGGRDAKRRTE